MSMRRALVRIPEGGSRAEVAQAVRKHWTSRHSGSRNWYISLELLYAVTDQDWVFGKIDTVTLDDSVATLREYARALDRACPGSGLIVMESARP